MNGLKTASVTDNEDPLLLIAVGRGDANAFRTVVDRHATAVHRVAFRMLGDTGEAEDATQEAFLRLWKQAGQWQSTGAGLPAWLRRVVTNLCLDRLRRTARHNGAMPADIVSDEPSASSLVDRATLNEVARGAMMALPAGQRAAVMLTYYEELSNGAAAEELGMKVKAFESLLLRARRALRNHIDSAGVSASDLESLQ